MVLKHTEIKSSDAITINFSTLPLSTNQLYAHQGKHRYKTQKAKDTAH